jgi:hypothetical protein
VPPLARRGSAAALPYTLLHVEGRRHPLSNGEMLASARVLERLATIIAEGEITAHGGTVSRLEGAALALRILGQEEPSTHHDHSPKKGTL